MLHVRLLLQALCQHMHAECKTSEGAFYCSQWTTRTAKGLTVFVCVEQYCTAWATIAYHVLDKYRYCTCLVCQF